MKLNYKDVFSVQSNDIKYRPTIVSYIIVILFIVILITLSNLIPILILSRFLMLFLTALIFYLTIALFSRLIFIFENIEKEKVKNKKYSFKYDSIFIKYEDFSNWLNNYSKPEQIVIKLKEEYHYIEISYETLGIRGRFINRKIYYDNKDMNIENIENIIKTSINDNKIEIFESFDHQNPNVIIDEIKELN